MHHISQHTRSPLAGHTLLGQCPASEDQHVAALPRLSREVPTGLPPKHSGVCAHRPLHSESLRAGRVQAPPLHGWCQPSRATLPNWTSDNASADTATSRPITILTWWLVRKGQRPTQNKYPNHGVLLACGDEQRLTIECDPVAPSRGLTTRAQNARPCHVIILRVLSWAARLPPRS